MVRLRVLLAACLVFAGCASRNATPPSAKVERPPHVLVVWVSVDGLRPDYLERATDAQVPFLRGMVVGWMTPTYPSLTFSVHASQVTGAGPGVHGIPGNVFYDRKLKEEFAFPPRPDLLKAEPVWRSVTRQGKRVAVFDWPFSQAQSGKDSPAYFGERYDAKMTDEQRMQRLIDVLRYDDGGTDKKPLSLVMGYIETVDKTGHQVGPDHPAVIEQLSRADGLLAKVWAEAVRYVRDECPPGTRLEFLVSTDHGMAAVEHVANLRLMLGDALPADARVVTGGGTAHVYLLDGPEKARQREAVLARLREYPFARAYTRETLPKHWGFTAGGLDDRLGDVFVDLQKGYTFTSRTRTALLALKDEGTTRPGDRAPRGMHSYDPREVGEMQGVVLHRQWPGEGGGGEYCEVIDARRLAVWVSGWLGVTPPSGAMRDGGVPRAAAATP